MCAHLHEHHSRAPRHHINKNACTAIPLLGCYIQYLTLPRTCKQRGRQGIRTSGGAAHRHLGAFCAWHPICRDYGLVQSHCSSRPTARHSPCQQALQSSACVCVCVCVSADAPNDGMCACVCMPVPTRHMHLSSHRWR